MADTPMTPIDRLALRARIDALNLDGPVHKLVVEAGWSLEQAEKVEEQYRCFLYLIGLHPDEAIVPTKDIDAFWHHHILDTSAYQADCEALFGRYLHHFPYLGLRGADDERRLAETFERTRRLFLMEAGFDPALA